MYPETFKIDTREKVAHFYEYSPILDKFEIKYLEDEYWLICGTLSFDNKWILMLAMRTSQTPKVLEDILDLLSEREVPFRIIKNQVLHYQLNSNFVSLGESAKAFTIFTRSDDECAYLIPKLQVLTNQYSGPQIEGALKIGSILYVAHSKITKLNGSGFEFSFKKPKPSALPIRLKRDDLIAPNPFKKIIGRNYILIETIRDDAKCSIYKAIKFKKLRFELCIIKRGKAHHNDDHFDRDIRDRLIWQHRVICKLQDKLRTAKVISIFKESEDICLVLEHVEGVILEHKMFYIKKNLPWRLLKSEDRSAILKYYLKIISIIRIIHENDYVHRDITLANFIVLPDDELCILDFELSYSLQYNEPDPPFTLGTLGYISPEQQYMLKPSREQDIFSVGVLLLHSITGIAPIHFFNDHKDDLLNIIEEVCDSNILSDLIKQCISPHPEERPMLKCIENEIKKELSKFNF